MQEKGQGIFWGEGSLIFILRVEEQEKIPGEVLMYWFCARGYSWDIRDTHTQTHKHTNTQTHKHTNTQTHKHTNTQTHKHTNTHTHTHTHTLTNVSPDLGPGMSRTKTLCKAALAVVSDRQ